MNVIDVGSETRKSSVERAEYRPVASSRHDASGVRVSGRRLRLTYFGVASLWGFVVGAAGVLAALQAEGQMRVPSGAWMLGCAIPGLAIAVGGGVVIAGAYQEAKRRR